MTAIAPWRIAPATSAEDLTATADLFRAYAASLDVDLCFQGFEAELASLPGKYAPPDGALLLARAPGGEPLGCVALRPMPRAGSCEMKRLYVTPTARGLRLGRALAEAILAEARRLGYREIRLDSLPTMTEAMALYATLGFEPGTPYYDTPITGTVFMHKAIDDAPPTFGLNIAAKV